MIARHSTPAGIAGRSPEADLAMYPINEQAPVKAVSTVTIAARKDTVWGLLTDINNWPRWNEDITSVRFNGEVSEGAGFLWKAGGMTIRSEIRQADPDRGAFAWTGRIWWIKGIHAWKIEERAPGCTRLTSSESLEGRLIGVFYSDDKLRRTLNRWLQALKKRAEATTR